VAGPLEGVSCTNSTGSQTKDDDFLGH